MIKIIRSALVKVFRAAQGPLYREITQLKEDLRSVNEKLEHKDFSLDVLKEKVKKVEQYQPIYGLAGIVEAPARHTQDRCNTILDSLGDVAGMRILDVGSSLGYVSFFFTDRGAAVDGWESNANNAEVARLAGQINGIPAAFFVKELTPATVSEIPGNKYDAVFILSVFHHTIRFQGLEATQEMVKGLLEKIPVMIVELARKGEDPSLPWDASQPEDELAIFKGLDVKITKIGSFGNHLSSKKRPLYKIESKKTVSVNGKQYVYSKASLSAYTKSPLRHISSFRRKYYFCDDVIIKEYELESEPEKLFNLPEMQQEIAALNILRKLKESGRLQCDYPEMVDVEITPRWSRLVIRKYDGQMLSDMATDAEIKADDASMAKVVDKVLHDVLRQLADLRTENIYHNDIRSWNIIVAHDGAQLIDYGDAAHLQKEDDMVSLLWSLYGFIVGSLEVRDGSDVNALPPKDVFKPFARAQKFYNIVAEGERNPATALKKIRA